MSETLVNFSKALADAVATAGKSVVRVEARRRLPATGFVWSDGVIVTAHHVVERDDNITIGLPDGEKVSATLAGRDPSSDLAVLRVSGKSLTAFAQVTQGDLKVGNFVLALGRPAQDVLATHGIISALGEGWQNGSSKVDRYVQTDVTMYPGFSGGPLIDASGALIGLNTSAMRDTSLCIPTTTISRVADALLKHGKIKQGYLGIGAQPVRLPTALREQLGQETGLLIASVEPDSPADKGGLLLGDTLVGLDGAKVRNMDELAAQLSSDKVGKAVSLKIVRGGQVSEVSVTVGERA